MIRQLPPGIKIARGSNGQIENTRTKTSWNGAWASATHTKGSNSIRVHSFFSKGAALKRIRNRARDMSISARYKRNGPDASVFVLGKAKRASTGRSSG